MHGRIGFGREWPAEQRYALLGTSFDAACLARALTFHEIYGEVTYLRAPCLEVILPTQVSKFKGWLIAAGKAVQNIRLCRKVAQRIE